MHRCDGKGYFVVIVIGTQQIVNDLLPSYLQSWPVAIYERDMYLHSLRTALSKLRSAAALELDKTRLSTISSFNLTALLLSFKT